MISGNLHLLRSPKLLRSCECKLASDENKNTRALQKKRRLHRYRPELDTKRQLFNRPKKSDTEAECEEKAAANMESSERVGMCRSGLERSEGGTRRTDSGGMKRRGRQKTRLRRKTRLSLFPARGPLGSQPLTSSTVHTHTRTHKSQCTHRRA